MSNQYLRKAQLLLVGGTDELDLSDLRFHFDITQADIETPQTAHIRVYNLSDTTRQKIQTNQYSRLIVQAGYESGNYGVIFDGSVIQPRRGRESPVDTFVDLLGASGDETLTTTLNSSLAKGATANDALRHVWQEVLGQLTTEQTTLAPPPDMGGPSLPRGQVFHGMARSTLHAIAATAGMSYFIDKGQLTFLPLEGVDGKSAVVLSADTGLINWPTQTESGIEIECLLNPLLGVGSTVKIDNASILQQQFSAAYGQAQLQGGTLPGLDDDGLYRVYVLNHVGDTRGQEWYSKMVTLSIDPSKTGLTALIAKGQF